MQFRLRDLLVLTAVAAVLSSLAMLWILPSREQARRARCADNLRQLGLGIHNYHDTFRCIPPGATGKDAAPRIGWRVRILPFTGKTHISEINMDLANVPVEPLGTQLPRDAEGVLIPQRSRKQAAEFQTPYSMCPNDPRDSIVHGFAQSSYAGSLGSQNTKTGASGCQPFSPSLRFYDGTKLFGDTDDKREVSGIFSRQMYGPMTLGDVKDGINNTFAAGEILSDCHLNNMGWWSYDGAANAHASTLVPLNVKTTCATSERHAIKLGYFMPECFERTNTNFSWGFRSNHPGGANLMFCDGSVQFINDDINCHIYQANGGRDDLPAFTE
jgi:prepilin-type processing-associated H-X9-DG protein